jgi:hypothetical protein
LPRSLQLYHLPLAPRHPPVHAGEFHVVGGNDGGQPRGAHQLGERREHMVGGVGVEIPRRLVGQQDARRVGDRKSALI